MMFESVVPDEINRMTVAWCDRDPHRKPKDILDQDWFVDNIILNPQLTDAVRSLLGPGLPPSGPDDQSP